MYVLAVRYSAASSSTPLGLLHRFSRVKFTSAIAILIGIPMGVAACQPIRVKY